MKPIYCKACGNPLEKDGKCKMCPAGNPRRAVRVNTVDCSCPWNDHGDICCEPGIISDVVNGQGPWYCSRHYWKLKGWPEKSRAQVEAGIARHVSVRDQWYLDNKQPYEPPKLEADGHFRSVAKDSVGLYARLRSGELGKRMREPGED